jgi:SPP1 family predicted phage head-tail adaptor
MDRSNVINLISTTKTQDDYGVWHEETTARAVFCNVQSVTRNEFFEGGRNGLNPQYEFTVFFADYNGETIVEFEGETYAVYRAFRRRDDTLELYVERKGGTNGKG